MAVVDSKDGLWGSLLQEGKFLEKGTKPFGVYSTINIRV